MVDKLLKNGEEVICLDNYFTGHKTNIALINPNFEFIRHDITQLSSQADRIWHLACPASPVHYQYNQLKHQTASGSLNMLGLAKRLKLEYFLLQQVKFTDLLNKKAYGNVNLY